MWDVGHNANFNSHTTDSDQGEPHTHTLSHTHTLTHTHSQSHKEEEVFQVVCETQGDPLIGCVIMIRLKIQKREKRQTHSAAMSGRVKLKERFNLVVYRCHPALING